jgi:cytochrome P450
MPLIVGARVGPYEIVSVIDIGEVYRARDTNSNRDVALRIVPEVIASDDDRFARLKRDVERVAALRHSSIAALYGIEDTGAGHESALVLELVEGRDLSQVIARGPIPLEEATPIAQQVADALGAAHLQGIVHGNLTSANIKVGTNGGVKVLGFGLATPGTAAYKSPEQLQGRAIDRRTDVWSFGAVLYEMLAGKRAFEGSGDADVLTSIEKAAPDWAALPADVPRPVVALLQRCLVKDRTSRMGDIAVARVRLAQTVLGDQVSSPPAVNVPSRSNVFLDVISTWIERSPQALRLVSGLARRVAPVLVVRNQVFVLGADAVREALNRASDFEIGPFGAPKMLMGPFLLGMDPRQQYIEERRVLEEVLASVQLTLETVTREECARAYKPLVGKSSIEVVHEFAEPVVTRIASRFYGVDLPDPKQTRVLAVGNGEELLAQWLRKVGSVIAMTSPAPFGLQRIAEACSEELRTHLKRQIEQPAAPDTVLAKLFERVRAGDLPQNRVLPNLAGLLLAGSTALVKSFVHALAQILLHKEAIPTEHAVDADAVKGLLFEALRFNPTFPVLLRYCPRATQIGEGVLAREIPAGAKLAVAPLGAMFDTEVADADRFSAHRPADEPIVFGWGPHRCLGHVLATTQLTEMLRVFLELPELSNFSGSRIRYDGPAVDRFVIRRAP